METFIIYIAKAGICLGIFLVIYSLFLRPTTFFRFNRIFLLSGFVVSLIIPAIKYTYEVVIPVSVVQNIEMASESAPVTSASTINIWIVLSSLYMIGTLMLIGRNIYAYTKLRKLVRSGVKYNNKGFKLVENTDINSPFTVLNYILMNTSNLSQIEKDLILKHEITHVNQKHWIDLLCSECILILQWFNPLAWVYVKLLKENHEFLADKAVIDSGVSPALYQAVLINQKFQGPVFSFSNSFNYSKPLNRLSMIKKAKSSPWKRVIVLAIIPIFGLFLWASSEPRYVFDEPDVQAVPDDSIVVIGYGSKSNVPADSLIKTKKIIITKKKDSISSYKSNTKIEIKGVYTMTGGDADPIVFIDGKKSDKVKMETINPADVESVSVLKDVLAAEMYGEDAKHGVIHIKTKEYVKNNPEQGSNKFELKTRKGMTFMKSDSLNTGLNGVPSKIIKYWKSNEPVIYLDGVKIKNLENINPNDIESIDVLKDKSAISIYGTEGKNGVILITSKKKDNTKQR
ncbi:TonB-dependent receptor plug domain-containing protein [Dysgonomonas sp. GY75]|uniref:M56 family metallopeptidase n=1 Tax=Dysgonomonas sp. GY75 TaxID=2780419 RepID=UPI0018835D6A|nr:M56 family metallopeptidase [Dysgonomonas sp. GY75]MBF0650914.1 TonB-dependent receptor plug domain-containing protein [Dysgonomonas sp. GY75]